MATPRPTIRRKAQNTTAEGGWSALGKSFSPCTTAPVEPWVIRLPSLGMAMAKRFCCASRSGQARMWNGCSALVSQKPFDRRQLGRLVLAHHLAGLVADDQLQQGDDGEHGDGHFQRDRRIPSGPCS